jgi:hypothetical protein
LRFNPPLQPIPEYIWPSGEGQITDVTAGAAGLGRIETFVQTSRVMDVQVAYDQDNPFSVWIDNIDQVA